MKISKTAVLTLSCVFSMAGLWLMVVSADSAKKISTDLDNAIQHIENIILISDSDKNAIFRQKDNRLVEIYTNNFVLSTGWDNKNEIFKNGTTEVDGSTVLWWIKNKIWGSYNVILWWEWNMVTWARHVILWWEWNSIGASANSVIAWWRNNRVNWASSVIVWWSSNELNGDNGFSLIVWSNSSVDWDYSAALWLNSHVNANKSFLWTDWNWETLSSEDVFAVVWWSGMVVGLDKAHSFAQLTLWGPIKLISSTDTNGIQCGGEEWWWTIKAVADGSNICLCSCDGSGRNSLFAFRRCKWKCDTNIHPKCGNAPVTKFCEGGQNTYTWSCEQWKIVEWSWAYFIDKHSIVHWACQTENGEVVTCSTWSINTNSVCPDRCGWEEPQTYWRIVKWSSTITDTSPKKWTYVTGSTNPGACEWSCKEWFELNQTTNKCVKKCGWDKPYGDWIRWTNYGDYVAFYNDNESQVYWHTGWTYLEKDKFTDVSCVWTCASGYQRFSPEPACAPIPPRPQPKCLSWIIPFAHANNDYEPSVSTYYSYSTNKTKPCTYSCDNGYNYIPELDECREIPPDNLCEDAHYGCKYEAYLVPGSESTLTQTTMIVYKWKCMKGSVVQDCEEKLDINGGCHHCASSGFPYCFPINFGTDCKEWDYY